MLCHNDGWWLEMGDPPCVGKFPRCWVWSCRGATDRPRGVFTLGSEIPISCNFRLRDGIISCILYIYIYCKSHPLNRILTKTYIIFHGTISQCMNIKHKKCEHTSQSSIVNVNIMFFYSAGQTPSWTEPCATSPRLGHVGTQIGTCWYLSMDWLKGNFTGEPHV